MKSQGTQGILIRGFMLDGFILFCSLFFAATQTKLQQIDYTYQTKLYVVEVFLRLLKRDLMRMCDLAEEKTQMNPN